MMVIAQWRSSVLVAGLQGLWYSLTTATRRLAPDHVVEESDLPSLRSRHPRTGSTGEMFGLVNSRLS